MPAAGRSRAILLPMAAGHVPCDLSGELISFVEAHLDHASPTFGQLVVSFRAARGWQHGVPAGVLTPPADAQTTTSFLDASAAQALQFHRGAATLRVVSRARNLAMSAGQRRPKIKVAGTTRTVGGTVIKMKARAGNEHPRQWRAVGHRRLGRGPTGRRPIGHRRRR